jgi:hypothetical protein
MESFPDAGDGRHGDRSTVISYERMIRRVETFGVQSTWRGNWEAIQDHVGGQRTVYMDTRWGMRTRNMFAYS